MTHTPYTFHRLTRNATRNGKYNKLFLQTGPMDKQGRLTLADGPGPADPCLVAPDGPVDPAGAGGRRHRRGCGPLRLRGAGDRLGQLRLRVGPGAPGRLLVGRPGRPRRPAPLGRVAPGRRGPGRARRGDLVRPLPGGHGEHPGPGRRQHDPADLRHRPPRPGPVRRHRGHPAGGAAAHRPGSGLARHRRLRRGGDDRLPVAPHRGDAGRRRRPGRLRRSRLPGGARHLAVVGHPPRSGSWCWAC